MSKVFVSPSSQEANVYATGTTEEIMMNFIADYLIPQLIKHGVEVMRNSRYDDYNGHVEKSNKYKPDLHLAIHSNAMGSGKARGCEVFCYDHTNKEAVGTQYAEKVYKYISAITPTADRGVKSGKDTISEVKYTHAPAVLVEIAFHDNTDDANWIMDNIKQISEALLLATLEQLGISKDKNAAHIAELNRLIVLLQKEIDSLI